MGFSQAGSTLVQAIPLACDISTRVTASGASYAQDSYLQNCHAEQDPSDGTVNVVKRPAFITGYGGSGGAYYPAAPGGLCTGQGIFNYTLNGIISLWAFANNTLWRVDGSVIPYGSASVSAWSTLTPSPALPTTSSSFATDNYNTSAIVFKKQIMLIGGYSQSTSRHVATVQNSFDGRNFGQLTQAPAWAVSQGQSGRGGVNLAVNNNRLYLMNGYNVYLDTGNAGYFNDCWSTDDGVVWTLETEDMGRGAGIYPRGPCPTVTFNGVIYMLGGFTYNNGSGSVTNQVIYSYDGKNWAIAPTPSWGARSYHAACVFNGAIYVMCGYNAGWIRDCWRSTNGQTWTNVYSSGLPAGRQISQIVVYRGLMYAFAYYAPTGFVREVYSSPDGATWTALAAPPWTNDGMARPSLTFTAPAGVYPIQYPPETIYTIDTSANAVYHATLDTNMSASFPIATAGAVTDQFQTRTMNGGQFLFIKNTSDAWYFTAGTMNRVVDIAYPGSTVRGTAYLNSRVYVMDLLGRIWGSELNDPSKWNGLNFILADFSGDNPVALAKAQNYVIAFKVASIMFFYDNGNAIGNTLSPVQNANAFVGCANANTVIEMANTVFWVSTYGGLRRSVSKLNGLSPQRVSTDDVERLLDLNPFSNVYAMSLKVNGQEFYVLSLYDSPATTLVYNNTTGKWSVWSSGADGVTTGTLPFRAINRAGLGQTTYVQDRQTNGIYAMSEISFQDSDQNGTTTAITTVIQPPKVTMNTHQPKFCTSCDLIGDKYISSNPVTVTYTDNDWQTSVVWGACDLSLDRPQVYRGGSFRKRGFRFTHTANLPLRAQTYELVIEPGAV
jgi:hypothetical protein